MYLNCCSLGYSHQMHISLLGEFPGERQSYSITTSRFSTTQTISHSITQSHLAGRCTEQSPYQLILIIILSTYKICFSFKVLFKEEMAKSGLPQCGCVSEGKDSEKYCIANTVLYLSFTQPALTVICS